MIMIDDKDKQELFGVMFEAVVDKYMRQIAETVDEMPDEIEHRSHQFMNMVFGDEDDELEDFVPAEVVAGIAHLMTNMCLNMIIQSGNFTEIGSVRMDFAAKLAACNKYITTHAMGAFDENSDEIEAAIAKAQGELQ